jgi:hypothetical protein
MLRLEATQALGLMSLTAAGCLFAVVIRESVTDEQNVAGRSCPSA